MKTTQERLNEALTIRNMKASDLHKMTNINKSSISQYLSGTVKPKQDRIYLLAQALNVDELWLMGHDVPMERRMITEPKCNTLSENDLGALVGAFHRKLREKYKGDRNNPEYIEELKAVNKFIGQIFKEKERYEKIAPITITDEAEQLLVIRYRTLDRERQNELSKRADELCTLYSMNVDMDKVKTISDLYKGMVRSDKQETPPDTSESSQ